MTVENTNERLDENIRRLFEVETMEMECNNETAASLRDRAVMERSDRNIKQEGDGHYKVVLPWKSKKHLLRSNYAQAKVRLEQS